MKKMRLFNQLPEQFNEIHYLTLLEATGAEEESVIEVLRVGTIQDRGLKITKKMLTDYVRNFEENVYGDLDENGKPELPVNLQHERGSAAAGWIKELFFDPMDEDRLMARVKWTELGIESIKKRLYKFVSAELFSQHPHHETGKMVDNVFVGLALTNTPALKSQKPLVLSEQVDILFNNIRMFKTILSEMKGRAYVSAEDKAMLKTLSEQLPADEKAEAAADVAEVQAKPEAPEKTAEEKQAEEAAKQATEQKLAEATKTAELLKEKETLLAQKEAELKTFREKEEATMLSEAMGKVMLSETNATGFVKEDKEKVEKFMKSLSLEQRNEFSQLVPTIKTVDLSERGKDANGSGENKVVDKDGDDMAIKAKAKAMAEKENIPYHQALAKCYAEMKKDEVTK